MTNERDGVVFIRDGGSDAQVGEVFTSSADGLWLLIRGEDSSVILGLVPGVCVDA